MKKNKPATALFVLQQLPNLGKFQQKVNKSRKVMTKSTLAPWSVYTQLSRRQTPSSLSSNKSSSDLVSVLLTLQKEPSGTQEDSEEDSDAHSPPPSRGEWVVTVGSGDGEGVRGQHTVCRMNRSVRTYAVGKHLCWCFEGPDSTWPSSTLCSFIEQLSSTWLVQWKPDWKSSVDLIVNSLAGSNRVELPFN